MSKAHTLDNIPLAEKSESKLARVARETRNGLEAYQRDSQREGGLMTKALAATVLNVSHQRVCQLVEEGRFGVFRHFDKDFLSTNQVKGLFAEERKAGRPWKTPSRLSLLKAAFKGGSK